MSIVITKWLQAGCIAEHLDLIELLKLDVVWKVRNYASSAVLEGYSLSYKMTALNEQQPSHNNCKNWMQLIH